MRKLKPPKNMMGIWLLILFVTWVVDTQVIICIYYWLCFSYITHQSIFDTFSWSFIFRESKSAYLAAQTSVVIDLLGTCIIAGASIFFTAFMAVVYFIINYNIFEIGEE